MWRYATTNKLLLFRRTYFSIGETIMKADNLASTLKVCLDSGAKKVLLPQTSAVDLGTVPAELMSSFSLVFYQSA
jgi:ATP-dependent Lon protease